MESLMFLEKEKIVNLLFFKHLNFRSNHVLIILLYCV